MRSAPLALALAALAGCRPAPPVAFPQQRPDAAQMEALVEGTLALDGRCLRLVADVPEGASSESYLVG